MHAHTHKTLVELSNVSVSVFQREQRTKLNFWRDSSAEVSLIYSCIYFVICFKTSKTKGVKEMGSGKKKCRY
jgi:hypothetical protein